MNLKHEYSIQVNSIHGLTLSTITISKMVIKYKSQHGDPQKIHYQKHGVFDNGICTWNGFV